MAPFPFPGLNELRDKYRYGSQYTLDGFVVSYARLPSYRTPSA